MVKRVGIHKRGEISLDDIIQTVRKNPRIKEAGAISCFIGIVRGRSKGTKVNKLYFEAYKEQAEKSLAKISSDLMKKPGIVDVLIHHMTGTLKVGENIVFVVVAGKSRKDVFPVVAEAVERLKREAPIWKKEYTEKNSHWVSGKIDL
ncbi:MAG TPA: molybdenum cofactor biosynthesis protein MoaE [archaeon]|nr:molybdenum cofactor biosynthesis protein MoaE [archaeon]